MASTTPFGRLEGFGDDALGALTMAAAEAAQLGHELVGTEHILLGLLSDDTPTAQVLRSAGVSLAAARHKVDEAVGTTAGAGRGRGGAATTKRATRAVEGAVRISHHRRAEAVSGGDLLLAVLNVEGQAGQVLRGLGVDVERLRSVVDQAPPSQVETAARGVAQTTERCSWCGAALEGGLRRRVVAAESDDGSHGDAVVFSCRACGAVLGVGPA
ncbi:MAG: hypothetical protein JF603_12410 [Acidobacteria bacterium]|nr:hypothetical protein [Acidobacteriota bacterium]